MSRAERVRCGSRNSRPVRAVRAHRHGSSPGDRRMRIPAAPRPRPLRRGGTGSVGGRAARYRLSLRLRDVPSTSVLARGGSSVEGQPGRLSDTWLPRHACGQRPSCSRRPIRPAVRLALHRVVRLCGREHLVQRCGRTVARAGEVPRQRALGAEPERLRHILVARPIGAGR